ncbi:MAG TPA: NAD-glutamate dehydrogenase domain-containing protein [Thermoanaerobaculia bacterium]|jgi:glutamate dehydrogenase|nr:NAD-glutamate dehydrogenase domain-containing protein [Thermoanaerobaculia bacterium]
MITRDPFARALRLAEIEELLKATAPPEDAALLLAFSRAFYAEMPDSIALDGDAKRTAERLTQHFNFFVHELPDAHQAGPGVPGLHVRVRNLGVTETRVIAGKTISAEVTVVDTHTVDAPFIFESLKNYFRKASIRVISTVHPILSVKRQWGKVTAIGPAGDEGTREVHCHFRIDKIEDEDRLREIEDEIHAVLKAVFASVHDFSDMCRNLSETAARIRDRRGDSARLQSSKEFLEWLQNDNYILQGLASYKASPGGELVRQPESALGVFTDPDLLSVVFPRMVEEIEQRLIPDPEDDRIIVIDYGNHAASLHSVEPVDDVVIREWAEDGSLTSITLLLGRFSMTALIARPTDIPLLRQKQDYLLENCGGLRNSHAYRETRAAFNRMPKRELFYTDRASLKKIVDKIVFATGDDDLFVQVRQGAVYQALYVVFPRSRYSVQMERDLKKRYEEAFGPITFVTSADLGNTSMIVFYFDGEHLTGPLDASRAEEIASRETNTWTDRVSLEMVRHFGDAQGRRLFDRYVRSESRSGVYREMTPSEQVPKDIESLEQLSQGLGARALPRSAGQATLKIFSLRPLVLSEIFRTLTNLGLKVDEEVSINLALPNGRNGHIYQFETRASSQVIGALATDISSVISALRLIDEGRATDDALQALILEGGLSAREIEVLRCLRNHLLQLRTHYNVETVNQAMLRNTPATVAISRHFTARFDPALGDDRKRAAENADGQVDAALDAIESLQDDEILRGLSGLVGAALRTNAFQVPERPVISIKFDSKSIPLAPSPKPMFEIAVHSRKVQGVHLRGGKVARGGIRWSDRHDDFRREVLGLMKTQMVKNSIIVPVGSKGGFVLKGTVPSRPALDNYLIERYSEYVSGLLDITDNIVDGAVLHPPDVVRYDGDDPYLVVAADKGTAHLSDTANGVSNQYGFWLGDAFASGGSVGYDHKKVGITARGAWECVKHHFANLGVDCQVDPITVAGIGDMGGDVFGNGMLMSRVIRLVAAFNHAHIFVDPTPDAAASFAERDRLFKLPRSSWRDYDALLISAGGGIFDRSAKSIPLSGEMRTALGIEADVAALSGEELIRAILRAPVDLLYNGGIGTYVKASTEEHQDVGDRANDRVRVDASLVQARVVSEGGNLGLTQKGRLELARRGVLLNTDAIDNSAGVDMSDHEVNIKILMSILLKAGALGSVGERNKLLAEMTEEVADLCLADNSNQALAITLDVLRSRAALDESLDCIDALVEAQFLNPVDDSVPTRDVLRRDSAETGLPRPLLAMLLGESKRYLSEEVMATEFPSSPEAAPLLASYFPERLQKQYAEHFAAHPLKREIVTTVAVNHVVNTAGIAFVRETMKASGRGVGEVFAAFYQVSNAEGAAKAREAIHAAAKDAASIQAELLAFETRLAAKVLKSLAG